MDMPYVSSEGVRIHYKVEGAGPPLVIQHGYTDRIETWYEVGYVETLKRDYRLILIDARGHGASGKPHDTEAYAMEKRVGDILAVLRELEVSRTHFFGYSMGGWIGFGMARYAPERLNALIIGGAAPSPRSREGSPLLQPHLMQQGAAAIPGIWDAPLSPALRDRLLANDIEAIRACRVDDPGFEDILPTMNMPCLLFAGDADAAYPKIKAAVTQMPNVTFFALPGLVHAEALFRSDLVLPHVTEFLRVATQAK
jgi:pimeloyl-ACP methyl ester carboxylesterase